MRLNEIKDQAGATKNRMRVGRGVGSGKGKTCGRGVKGQKSRRGVAISGFEGGQMPLHMRIPKRGFNAFSSKRHAWVNLGSLQKAIDAKKLDPKKPIDADALIAAGLVRRAHDGVRLLARGELKTQVNLVLAGASEAAKAAVERVGGTISVPEPRKAAAKAE